MAVLTEKKWRESLRRGDEVIVTTASENRVLKVQRVTATQIVVEGSNYTKSRGRRVGGSEFWRAHIRQPTKERRVKAERDQFRKQAIARLRSVKWSEHSGETLRAVLAELDKVEA